MDLPSALGGHLISRGDFYRTKFIPGPGLDVPVSNSLFIICVPGCPPEETWIEADEAFSVCWWLRNDEAETRDRIIIFNPGPAPALLVICFCRTLVSEGMMIPFKKDAMFPYQLIKLSSLDSRMLANLKTGKHSALLQFTFGLNSIQRVGGVKLLSLSNPEGEK